MNLKQIVIINQDSGYLMIDIANAISGKDFNVSLITGRLVLRDKPLSELVKVNRVIKYNRRNKLGRLISWVIAFFQIVFLIKVKYRKAYLFIVTNPPLTTFIPLFCRNRFSVMIFDVYPDTLTEMGIIGSKSFIVRSWKKVNRKVFLHADNIFTLSENMALRLQDYINRDRISVIPVWSDNQFFKPIEKKLNPFVSENGLEGKFVVLYSGNLGATHNVGIIPDLASAVKDPRVLFLIIGDGDKRKWLQDIIIRHSLTNCIILPLQPVEKIRFSFASADLSVVSLSEAATNLSVPSKTFNFMSAGLPLLCIASHDSELFRLVAKYENGMCFEPDKIGEIVSFIEGMVDNKELMEKYKANSLKASLDFTSDNAEKIAQAVKISFDTN
jgi:glycosyltransferase involved in cell wall biosynthesis